MSEPSAENKVLLPRDQRRAQILRAAAQAFSEDGYVSTSVDEVAKAAGITKLIVYRHFDSKADLYRAILEETAERLNEEWERNTANGRYRGAAIRSMLTVGRERPDAFRLFLYHAPRERDFEDFAEAHRALHAKVVEEVLSEYELSEAIRRWAIEVIVDMVHTGVLGWISVGDPSEDDEWMGRVSIAIRAFTDALAGTLP